ncbi:MAG: sigma-70 family RNA polymerase sigma factor, partial [Candidatus Firestonebacteria bacterium]|nr:sigma-70 family RNA polymerase sigma factor [Candidatus Firestonebacteria bacterium]
MSGYVHMSDAQLIFAFESQDENAGNELVRRYYPKVYAWCLRRLLSPADAADAAQDVFMRVMAERKIFSFQGKASLSSWLFTVTRNVCMSFYRVKSRRLENQLKEMEEYHSPRELFLQEEASPERHLEKADQLLYLYSAAPAHCLRFHLDFQRRKS